MVSPVLQMELSCQSWSGTSFWEVLKFQSFGRFRTGQNLDLWNLVFVVCCQLSWVLHEFSFLMHDMSMGFMCTETTVICFAVVWRVVHSLAVGFVLSHSLPQVCYTFVLSETLSCDWTHITCQDVRHASWGISEFDPCRKCGTSVEVWVAHLGWKHTCLRFGVLGMVNLWGSACSRLSTAEYAQAV